MCNILSNLEMNDARACVAYFNARQAVLESVLVGVLDFVCVSAHRGMGVCALAAQDA